jgi:CO/xanthine dehydrogenase FAD-binding subunit
MRVNDRMWLPPGVDRADTAKQMMKGSASVRRPFEKLAASIRQMGFECKWRVDRNEMVVEVEFKPMTPQMVQAVKVYSGSSQATALRVAQAFGVLDDERQVVLHCIEKGVEELRQL